MTSCIYCSVFVSLQHGAKVHPDILSELVRPSIDYVRHKKFRSGNFPSSLSNESDRLVHWCHGAPGVIHMLIMAHKVRLGGSLCNNRSSSYAAARHKQHWHLVAQLCMDTVLCSAVWLCEAGYETSVWKPGCSCTHACTCCSNALWAHFFLFLVH